MDAAEAVNLLFLYTKPAIFVYQTCYFCIPNLLFLYTKRSAKIAGFMRTCVYNQRGTKNLKLLKLLKLLTPHSAPLDAARCVEYT
jgi:hypothetical protein